MTARTAFISAPVNALLEGLYRDSVTVGQMLAEGDLGLGTFNDLDGEMVVLDGRVWQVDATGTSRYSKPAVSAALAIFSKRSIEGGTMPSRLP